MEQNEIVRLIASSAGPFLVIAWLIYHTFVKTLPEFHQQMNMQRRELVEELKDSRRESATIHQRHAESIDKLCDSINALECRQQHRHQAHT